MRLDFAGTPEFARLALDALIAAGHDVALVLTQPDRPSGRGLKLTPSPVKQAAEAAGIPVSQPRSLRLDGKYPQDAAAARQALLDAAPEIMVVAAYGLILPDWALALPEYGCLNIHASLLPRWRGAAPIQRAIQAGDAETGITIMMMDQGLDTGAMLLTRRVPISASHTAAALHDELAEAGAAAIVEALQALQDGTLMAQPQPEDGVTYAEKLDKAEAPLDFTQPAEALARRHALRPQSVPGLVWFLATIYRELVERAEISPKLITLCVYGQVVPTLDWINVAREGYELLYVEVPHKPFDDVFHPAIVELAPTIAWNGCPRCVEYANLGPW